jgi:quinol monooxygenase YgiN
MAKIAIIVEYDVPSENRAEFDVQLRKNVQETLQDEGCLRMEILRHTSESEHVVLNELWDDEASIENTGNDPVMTTATRLSIDCYAVNGSIGIFSNSEQRTVFWRTTCRRHACLSLAHLKCRCQPAQYLLAGFRDHDGMPERHGQHMIGIHHDSMQE